LIPGVVQLEEIFFNGIKLHFLPIRIFIKFN
jgi:hypothetical protein